MLSIVGLRGVWNWDCALHAYTISRWNPPLARDQIDIFIELEKDIGLFPDVLRKNVELSDQSRKNCWTGHGAIPELCMKIIIHAAVIHSASIISAGSLRLL